MAAIKQKLKESKLFIALISSWRRLIGKNVVKSQKGNTLKIDGLMKGAHVWGGHGATILKGVTIMKDSILATKAVVTKSFMQEGVVLAGNPAKIVKDNITWDVARLPIGESCYE